MADEEPQPQSIAERIARLKVSQVGQPHQPTPAPKPNGMAGKARAPPPPPPARPNGYNRAASTNNPPLADHGDHVSNRAIGNQPEEFHPDKASANGMDGISRPALPARTSTQSSQASSGPKLPPRTTAAASPALPPRRPSEMTLSRKASNDSVSSMGTTHSSISMRSNGTSITSRSERYAVRAPEFNPAALPPLPPKRTKEEVQAHDQKYNAIRPGGSTSSSLSSVFRKSSAPNIPTRPQLPGRPTLPARTSVRQEQTTPVPEETQGEPPARRAQAPPPPRRSALTLGFGNPSQPKQEPKNPTLAIGAVPPPIPTSSRPDLAALQASKPMSNGTPTPQQHGGAGFCLHCRDFSGPDNHAARFPRESIPSTDIGWLAHQLTSPFPSKTDKARVIFAWLHHNVAYDVVAFYNNAVKSSTPQSTMASGLAVCEGYAGLFAALGMKAGLEVIVVSGGSKGYGHTQVQPGEAIPPFKSTHAWNACRIDGGEWKLIDPCWGAGNVSGAGQPYNKQFSPHHFTQSNDDFGRSHFPSDNSKQFRNDGRIQTYEEYARGSKSGTEATIFGGFLNEEGLSEGSFQPKANPIIPSQQGPTTRFMFQKICPHWDPVRNGSGQYYIYMLNLDAMEQDRSRNGIPFQQANGVWWCDVPTADLGRPGQKAHICAVTEFDGRDGRGLTLQEFRERKNMVGQSFGGVAQWEIA